MFGRDAMTGEDFVVGGKEGAERRVGRLLRVRDNLEEDVDIWKSSSALEQVM